MDLQSDFDYAGKLQACARGDEGALRDLFDHEGPKLTGVAMRILHRRDLAEEAVQDGFVRIWKNAATFDPALGSGRGWIYAIIRYRALNLLRDRSREDAVDPSDLDRMREQTIEEAGTDLDSEGLLRHCLDALDQRPRKAILLTYVLGMTHGEVAGRMHVPLGTAKAWIRRALAALRECMS
ncbi:sigma-70 family RNA polymerase sigma factor [Amaricoccus macauensis]|uniref:sigma-70 family RNA polymerase sigma factor n=1 Tax=Amaricoccus macauensis TaxID=57001 RepID=UPI003C7EBBF1